MKDFMKSLIKGFNNIIKNRILLNFLIPYIMLLIASLLVGIIVNYKTFGILEKEVINNNYALLEQSKRNIDRRLSEISSITQFVTSNSQVLKFQHISNPFFGSNIYRIIDTRNSLIDFSLTNNFILGYYVLFSDSNTILSPGSTYKFDEFYEYIFHYNDMNFEQWNKQLFSKYNYNRYLPAMPAEYKKTNYSIVTCIKSFDNFSSSKGSVIVLIDNKQLQSALYGLDISKNGWAYIADDKGNILSYITADPKQILSEGIDLPENKNFIKKDNMLITYTASDYNKWRYVVAQPYSTVVQKVTSLSQVMLIIFFVFLLFGILVAYLMAYLNSKPLSTIVNAIHGKETEGSNAKNAYELIQTTLSGLIDNNEFMKKKIEDQLPILKDSFFRRLFKGEISTTYELDTLMQHVNLRIKGNAYGIVIIHLKGYQGTLTDTILQELAIKRLLINETFNAIVHDGLYLHIIDQDKIALLLTCDSSGQEAWKNDVNDIINHFSSNMFTEYNIILSFYVGNLYENLLDISLSYKEALCLMDFVIPDTWNNVMWYWEFPKNTKSYYYPEEIEMRLANIVRAGIKVEAAALLDELYNENLVRRKLPFPKMNIFLYEILGSLTKLLEQIPVRDRKLQNDIMTITNNLMNSSDSPNHIFQSMKEVLCEICDEVDDRKKSHNVLLIDDIIEFISDSYIDSSLCLSAVARKFNLSEVYLSQFFKEQTGENFSIKLELIRMGKALELLTGTELSIKEITNLVGYNSPNTFCRAFKRIYNISATQYRSSTIP